ncbi:hypothetical protein CKA32_003927 [Geitlerinema sp. FC II]|nr:hypothetical protein CKA32_003927 [Geitlerinema sp. FC II]
MGEIELIAGSIPKRVKTASKIDRSNLILFNWKRFTIFISI